MIDTGVVDDLKVNFPAGGPTERQRPRRAHPLPLFRADFPPEGVLQLIQVLVLGVGQVEQGSLETLQVVVGVDQVAVIFRSLAYSNRLVLELYTVSPLTSMLNWLFS